MNEEITNRALKALTDAAGVGIRTSHSSIRSSGAVFAPEAASCQLPRMKLGDGIRAGHNCP